jgi:hypothetical protein
MALVGVGRCWSVLVCVGRCWTVHHPYADQQRPTCQEKGLECVLVWRGWVEGGSIYMYMCVCVCVCVTAVVPMAEGLDTGLFTRPHIDSKLYGTTATTTR